MKNFLLFLIIIIGVITPSCDVLSDIMETQPKGEGRLSQAEISEGLKEALMVGTRNTVNTVSAHNGFYQNREIFIPFPPEAQRVKEVAESLGMDRQINEFEERLNRAAETAARGATDIFINSIRQMTIRDAMGILQGNDDAATEYLKRTSYNQLYSQFYPVVEEATSNVNLARFWLPLANRYNSVIRVSGGEPVDPDLNNYVTEKTIEGIFVVLAKEEQKIRREPGARVNEILKRVFGSHLNPYN